MVKKENTDLVDPEQPTGTEIVLIEVHSLMETNDFYSNMPKPTLKYIENFLAQQPQLKTMPFIQKRESFLNLVTLCWMRDLLLSDAAKAYDDEPKAWKDKIEPKQLRLLMKIIKTIQDIMPVIFKEDTSRIETDTIAKKIVTTITVEKVEFDLKALPEAPLGEDVLDADFRIVNMDEEEPGG